MALRAVIRPVETHDLDALYGLTTLSTGGLTSLQSDKDFLARYIDASRNSFAGALPIDAAHKFLVVLVIDEAVVGCAAVKTKIGYDGGAPFINFDLSPDGKFLTASDRFAGATEVGSLFLHPDYRKDGYGRYLAKSRYLLIASQPDRFSQTIIAELRGVSGHGRAPFYDAVFKARLGKSFLDADNLYATTQAKALATITPDNPIHTDRLPAKAAHAMGVPHPSGLGALTLLHREGFYDSRTIDLFDGGPIVAAYREKITTITESCTGRVSAAEDIDEGSDPLSLIAIDDLQNFRAVLTPARFAKKCALICAQSYEALGATAHSHVRLWTRNQEQASHV